MPTILEGQVGAPIIGIVPGDEDRVGEKVPLIVEGFARGGKALLPEIHDAGGDLRVGKARAVDADVLRRDGRRPEKRADSPCAEEQAQYSFPDSFHHGKFPPGRKYGKLVPASFLCGDALPLRGGEAHTNPPLYDYNQSLTYHNPRKKSIVCTGKTNRFTIRENPTVFMGSARRRKTAPFVRQAC